MDKDKEILDDVALLTLLFKAGCLVAFTDTFIWRGYDRTTNS